MWLLDPLPGGGHPAPLLDVDPPGHGGRRGSKANCINPVSSPEFLAAYADTKLLSWLTGKTIGIGIGGGAGSGIGGNTWGLGFQGSASVLIVTDFQGNSGIVYSLGVGPAAMGAIPGSGGLVGGANIGVQYVASGKTLNQLATGLSYSFSGAVGPVAADVGTNGAGVTIGEGVGGRAGAGVQPGASGMIPICKLGG